ncbi:MAG: UDP-4-amino-4,6-dideoxy-N-acetyl-beta-L-altrosamine transaminase [Proteobacteria bacterium]|nr:UDP-4-amino-4,6-dideoxy-N-acetyl-beta-L-altrosamine transaminase [Pseudomonadota bacterium]
MNFIPYGRQYIDDTDIEAVVKALRSDYLTQGPAVDEFEKSICEYTGAKYCVAVCNGTAALHLAVKALDVQSGLEGITTTNTFVASSNCLVYNNLRPVFADIDERTYNIDPVEVEKKITSKTKIIIPVHFAGQTANMEKIFKFSKNKDIHIIEDASHAIGSKYKCGTRVGSCKYSDMTVFSFHPVKTITTGEGGAITTNNEKLYKKLRILRTHGITKQNMSKNPGPWYYEMQDLGFNYRLTDLQALLGTSQMRKIDLFIKRRREIIDFYNNIFKGLDWLITPYQEEGVFSALHLYVLKIDFNKIEKTRKQVMEELKEKNIGTQVHYIPVHTQPYYVKTFGYKQGDYPNAEKYYEQALSIPLYPKMTEEEVEWVVDNIKGLKR